MRPIIVSGLHKAFSSKRKAAGLKNSLRALIRPEHRTVEAVRELSFVMEPGECLGFIGPNGAGKSTTIKILTGILHPTSGEAKVLGHTPWQERRKLAYKIGTVFGQRPQLWYHLPAIDTFHLFGRIYELDDTTIRRRVELLSEAFDIEDLLETPVRKLSLGQRMRCEVAASLLHSPKLILLDEPSIGLDVVAKQRIRDIVRDMNERENTSVLLTSHDAGDIEALCERVIIINEGVIVYQGSVTDLKRRHLTRKHVEVRYASAPPPNFAVDGAETLSISSYCASLQFDTKETGIAEIVSRVAASGELVDVTISDPSLEEIIRDIYSGTGKSTPSKESTK
jgi:ABC-2 type transport system ATP-binding protein